MQALNDSSYTVAGNALNALMKIDTAAGIEAAKRMVKMPSKGKLSEAITTVLLMSGDANNFDAVAEGFDRMPVTEEKLGFLESFADLVTKMQNTDKLKKGIDAIVKLREAIPKSSRNDTDPFINNYILKQIADKKDYDGLKEQADYIRAKLPAQK